MYVGTMFSNWLMQALLCNFFLVGTSPVEPSSTLNMNEVLIFLVKQAVAGFNFQPSQSATWYDTDKPILFTTWNRQLSQLGLSNILNG